MHHSLIFICYYTSRSNTHHQRLWKNVVMLPKSKLRERRYHNIRNQGLIFWILQLNHRHHHSCHLKRRNHRLQIGLDITKILHSLFIWVGDGMEWDVHIDQIGRILPGHDVIIISCLCMLVGTKPKHQWKRVHDKYHNISDVLMVKMWRGKMKSIIVTYHN